MLTATAAAASDVDDLVALRNVLFQRGDAQLRCRMLAGSERLTGIQLNDCAISRSAFLPSRLHHEALADFTWLEELLPGFRPIFLFY